jgi:hypothetical protein
MALVTGKKAGAKIEAPAKTGRTRRCNDGRDANYSQQTLVSGAVGGSRPLS